MRWRNANEHKKAFVEQTALEYFQQFQSLQNFKASSSSATNQEGNGCVFQVMALASIAHDIR